MDNSIAIAELIKKDQRFKLEAYRFVSDAMNFAREVVYVDPNSHLTGQQLCEGCRLYAVEQYGFLSKIVLNSWGITSTQDIGEVVFNLIEVRCLRKSETDCRADFDEVFDFETAFEPEFAPLLLDSKG